MTSSGCTQHICLETHGPAVKLLLLLWFSKQYMLFNRHTPITPSTRQRSEFRSGETEYIIYTDHKIDVAKDLVTITAHCSTFVVHVFVCILHFLT